MPEKRRNVAKSRRKPAAVSKPKTVAQRLQRALEKRRKAELIDAIVDLARDETKILRRLEDRFDIQAPSEELINATRQAIIEATDFDQRDAGYNFDYDYDAYEAIERNFHRLIDLGELRSAIDLSLDF